MRANSRDGRWRRRRGSRGSRDSSARSTRSGVANGAERRARAVVDRGDGHPRQDQAGLRRGAQVVGLGLVAAGRERHPLERVEADQPHAALGVRHRAAEAQSEQAARDRVGQAARPRHRAAVAAPVSDHDVGARRGGDEGGHAVGRVLPVGVDHHQRVGSFRARQQGGGARGHGVALPGVLRQPDTAPRRASRPGARGRPRRSAALRRPPRRRRPRARGGPSRPTRRRPGCGTARRRRRGPAPARSPAAPPACAGARCGRAGSARAARPRRAAAARGRSR